MKDIVLGYKAERDEFFSFFKKFNEGKIGDGMDFIELASIYQMY